MNSAVFVAYFTIIILFNFLFPISNATPSVDDKMLIAFINGNQQVHFSEYSTLKFEAHLGIVYFMRKNWQCDQIGAECRRVRKYLDIQMRKNWQCGKIEAECRKYRKYLDILFEYLFREYVGIPTVKPKFVFQREIEINGPLIYAVNCLAKISQYYFNKRFFAAACGFKLVINRTHHFDLKLLNEHRLNYQIKLENEQKLPINEMILQLAIDTANGYQINESLDGIIRLHFDINLEEMLKKVEQRARRKHSFSLKYFYDFDIHTIIVKSIFDDYYLWTDDALFSEYVKGLATNSEKFFKMAKEYSNYLHQIRNKGYIECYYDERMISFGLYENEKMKEYLKQKYEAHLGLLYLMRQNWQCDKIEENFDELKRGECQKYQKYLHILYEYFFRVYAEAKKPNMANQLSAVKPLFKTRDECINNLIHLRNVIRFLNNISKCFWKKGQNELKNINYFEMELPNEEETNYTIEEEEENGQISERQNEKQLTEIRKIRTEFDEKMKFFCENGKKTTAEEHAKLEKALAREVYDWERKVKKYKFEEKTGGFNSSPFE